MEITFADIGDIFSEALRRHMWGNSRREYGLCSSVSLWLGQSIAFHHRGKKIQRISDSGSPIQNSEEPFLIWNDCPSLTMKKTVEDTLKGPYAIELSWRDIHCPLLWQSTTLRPSRKSMTTF